MSARCKHSLPSVAAAGLAQAGTLAALLHRKALVPVVRQVVLLTGLGELAFFARAAKKNAQWMHDLADALPDE